VQHEKEQTRSAPATIFMTVALVGILVCAATIFEFYGLAVMNKARFQSDLVVAIVASYFLGAIVILLISRGRLLRPLVASVFCMASLYLLSQTAISLFVATDYLYAIENAMWMVPLQVCLFATLGRRTASVLAGSLFGLLVSVLGAYFFFRQINPAATPEATLLVQAAFSQAAALLLLGALATYRDLVTIKSARVTALEENQLLLRTAASQAEESAHRAEKEQAKAVHALNKAEEATRAREAFLASMSHELRTPLNAIIGFSQILEMGEAGIARTEEKRLEYAKDIRNSGEHMLGLVGQVLEFSRIESEGCDIELAEQRLSPVADGAMRMVDVLAAAKDVQLLRYWDQRFDFDVETDDKALSQILVNLLTNAVKFTPKGGQVWLVLKTDGAKGYCIEVQDNGIGIPTDKLQDVFKPFVQIGDARCAGEGGTGLGLSIVSTLVRGLGGQFEIESAVGTGTCCRVRLPGLLGTVPIEAEEQPEDAAKAVG
jgi:two-component system, cell cycle sensor histidine kinase PleC